MTERYTFRVDVIDKVSEEETNRRMEQLLKTFDKYIISYEISKKKLKPHYQGIIFTDMKHETYKKLCEKAFPEWKGKRGDKCGMRSFAIVRKDEYEIYCVKDGDIRYRKGYTDDEIKTLQSKSYQVIDKDQQSYEKKFSFNEIIVESFRSTYPKERLDDHIKMVNDTQRYKRDVFERIALEIRNWLMNEYDCLNKDFDCDILGRKVNMLMNKFLGDPFRKWYCMQSNLGHRF